MTVPDRGLLPYVKYKNSSDQGNACIQIVLRYGDTRSVRRYLSFVPDECLTGDPDSVVIGANDGFANAYRAFQGLITNKAWNIRARLVVKPNDEVPIQGWTASDQAPNNMGAVLILANAPQLIPGDKVAIKGTRRVGTDKTSYNAIYRVKSTLDDTTKATRTVFLDQTSSGAPTSIKVYGKLQKVDYGPFPIQKWSWFRAGTHKRGVSYGAPHGRRLKRASLV
jgi:hypothetical protein